MVQTKKLESYSFDRRKETLGREELLVPKNPAYNNRPKRYSGVSFQKLVQKLEMDHNLQGKDYKIVFTCTGGFRPTLEKSLLKEAKALLADREMNLKRVEKLSKNNRFEIIPNDKLQDPEPFYLVWEKAKKTYPQGWSYRIEKIQLVPLENYKEFMAR